jgi:hypothetical protein
MRRFALFAICFAASGCAPAYRPAVDMTGVNPDVYHDDLAACRTKTGPGFQTGQSFAGGPMFADTVILASVGVAAAPMAGFLFTGAATNLGLAESTGAISGAAAGGTIGAATGASPGKAPSAPPPPSDPKAALDRCLTDYVYKLQAQAP